MLIVRSWINFLDSGTTSETVLSKDFIDKIRLYVVEITKHQEIFQTIKLFKHIKVTKF